MSPLWRAASSAQPAGPAALHEGTAAYSCLTVLQDGSIGCLYERGDEDRYERITFARFGTEWLVD